MRDACTCISPPPHRTWFSEFRYSVSADTTRPITGLAIYHHLTPRSDLHTRYDRTKCRKMIRRHVRLAHCDVATERSASRFWEVQRRCLGNGLLDLDDLAGTRATNLAGRGLLAATLRAQERRGADNGNYNR